MTSDEVTRILRVLRGVWTNEPVTEATIAAWTFALDDVAYADVNQAVGEYLKSGSAFFPKPSELRRIIAERIVAPGLTAESAWAEVRREVSRVGLRPLPVWTREGIGEPLRRQFSHPLIERAVEGVGWPLICTGDQARVREQFVRSFDALLARERREAQLDGAALGAGMAQLAEQW